MKLEGSSTTTPFVYKRTLDLWLVGGVSLLFFALFQFFVSPQSDVAHISWIMYYLSFFVNWPHFMASYQLLYQDQSHQILKKPAFFWAGIVVPLLLLGFFGFWIMSSNAEGLSWMIQFMFITVGWHYVKQVFGMMVVPAAQSGLFYSKLERRVVLFNLYCLWALSFGYGQSSARGAEFYGVRYAIVGVPDEVMQVLLAMVLVSALGVVWVLLKKFIREGRFLHPYGLLAYVSLYVWYLPAAQHPHFFYMIPFFHSLQYLMFVLAVKNREYSNAVDISSVEGRQFWIQKMTAFFGLGIILGLVSFLWLPSWLDSQFSRFSPYQSQIFGGSVFMACFHLFINIHHYFIDNVIWKKDSPTIRILMAKNHDIG